RVGRPRRGAGRRRGGPRARRRVRQHGAQLGRRPGLARVRARLGPHRAAARRRGQPRAGGARGAAVGAAAGGRPLRAVGAGRGAGQPPRGAAVRAAGPRHRRRHRHGRRGVRTGPGGRGAAGRRPARRPRERPRRPRRPARGPGAPGRPAPGARRRPAARARPRRRRRRPPQAGRDRDRAGGRGGRGAARDARGVPGERQRARGVRAGAVRAPQHRAVPAAPGERAHRAAPDRPARRVRAAHRAAPVAAPLPRHAVLSWADPTIRRASTPAVPRSWGRGLWRKPPKPLPGVGARDAFRSHPGPRFPGSVIALLAPGQGSQTPGMLAPWLDDPAAEETLARWSDATGLDLRRLGSTADADEIKDTAVTQPLVVAGALLAAARLTDRVSLPAAAPAAGHSVGELAAAAVAEVLTPDAAVSLAAVRGREMAAACALAPTGMSAVLGGKPDEVLAKLAELGLDPANRN